MVKYTEGTGIGPLGYELLQLAMKLYAAQETALGLRAGRRQND
jgi:hypothetical protein